jgi:hypothetical protein
VRFPGPTQEMRFVFVVVVVVVDDDDEAANAAAVRKY